MTATNKCYNFVGFGYSPPFLLSKKKNITRKFCHNFNVTAKKFLKNTVTKISLYQSTSCITVFFPASMSGNLASV